ncbi:tripartite tricarboxylate transporter TctB family protein [Xinfangfangia pollutisoli]|uniref:tripartite tricarboxylate transporter TctB family protein n=1 Tax=Xinfangfangia pollutisoli TaxID=2865960 RepID=UPI001CD33094|nr:tripartite tricarboxylate transporter TctB family protein [Xinfangfangia pollutisoli]
MKATHHKTDLLSGASILAVGLAISAYCMANLERGTLVEPGPGGFPLVLGLLLVLNGAISLTLTLIGGRRRAPADDAPAQGLNLRVLGLVVVSIAAFGLALESFGLFPACFVSVLIASFVAKDMGAAKRLIAATGAGLLAVVIFSMLLSVPVDIVTWPMEAFK